MNMRLAEALKIINSKEEPKGFMVSFEHKDGCILRGDHFPDKYAGEELIQTEDEAWALAKKFAAKTKGHCINIYVVDENFSPVPGYEFRKIENR